MKKMFLALLSLLVVSMFLVSCGPKEQSAVAGQAIGKGDFLPKPAESSCKIISVISSDYQWIYNSGLTASQVCAKENLKCKGVGRSSSWSYLDDNHKVQAVDNEYRLLSSYYCNEEMGKTTSNNNLPENSRVDYSEPYAGPVSVIERLEAVLCCK